MKPPKNGRRPVELRRAVSLGALVFAATAPGCYAAQRLYEIARVGRVDPALILRATHVDFLWRAAVASWFGGMCALFVVAFFGRSEQRLLRWLAALVAIGGALFLIGAWRYP